MPVLFPKAFCRKATLLLLFLYILHNFCLQLYIFNMLYDNCEYYILYCLHIFIILQTITVFQWLLNYFLWSCVWSLKSLLLSFIFSSLWQIFLKESEDTGFIQFLKIKWIGIFLQYLDRLFTMLVYAFTCSLRWAQKSAIGSVVLFSRLFLASTSVHVISSLTHTFTLNFLSVH